jgi:hypothetical protein
MIVLCYLPHMVDGTEAQLNKGIRNGYN